MNRTERLRPPLARVSLGLSSTFQLRPVLIIMLVVNEKEPRIFLIRQVGGCRRASQCLQLARTRPWIDYSKCSWFSIYLRNKIERDLHYNFLEDHYAA
jgi:hypothetical protein